MVVCAPPACQRSHAVVQPLYGVSVALCFVTALHLHAQRCSSMIACVQGVTRFEDRNRLPLGTTVNFTAYSARMLTQAAYNPLVGQAS